MSNLVLIYTTFANSREAEFFSHELLNKKLISCVNIFPKIKSFYFWENRIQNSAEIVATMKSRSDKVDSVIKIIEASHSYKEPVILVIPIEKANKSFTNWINSVIDAKSIGV